MLRYFFRRLDRLEMSGSFFLLSQASHFVRKDGLASSLCASAFPSAFFSLPALVVFPLELLALGQALPNQFLSIHVSGFFPNYPLFLFFIVVSIPLIDVDRELCFHSLEPSPFS